MRTRSPARTTRPRIERATWRSSASLSAVAPPTGTSATLTAGCAWAACNVTRSPSAAPEFWRTRPSIWMVESSGVAPEERPSTPCAFVRPGMRAGDGRTRADDLDDVIWGAAERGERGGADVGDAARDTDALGDGQLDGAGSLCALSACAHKGKSSSPHRTSASFGSIGLWRGASCVTAYFTHSARFRCQSGAERRQWPHLAPV